MEEIDIDDLLEDFIRQDAESVNGPYTIWNWVQNIAFLIFYSELSYNIKLSTLELQLHQRDACQRVYTRCT